MCVKLIKFHKEIPFDAGRPLEDQIVGCSKVLIDFKPNDPQLEKFLDEIERFAYAGLNFKLNVEIMNNSHIMGARTKKQIMAVIKEFRVNDIIKLMTGIQKDADDKLSELISLCQREIR